MPNPQPSPQLMALQRGATVLTSNKRAARALTSAFDMQQIGAGHRTWQPPSVLPWGAWTSSLWRTLLLKGHDDRIVLNAEQERLLWTRIIEEDMQTSLSAEDLAEMAFKAHSLLARWNIPQNLSRYLNSASSDTLTFHRWLLTFNRICKADRYVAAAQLDTELAKILNRSGHIFDLPREVLALGFDSITPAQLALQTALQDCGVQIQHIAPEASPLAKLVQCADSLEELQTAATWLVSFADSHPGATSALIVPDLASQRNVIARTFRDIAACQTDSVTLNNDETLFEFSLGQPLSATSMVSDALLLLRWTIGALDFEEASSLLRSPWLGSPEQVLARAEFDAFRLRKLTFLRPALSLESFLRHIAKSQHYALQSLHTSLSRLHHVAAERATGRRSLAEWSDTVRDLLQTVGWPGLRELTSIDFQLRDRWHELLDQLSALDFWGERIPFSGALDQIQKLSSRTLFAPQSAGAPIQIMDATEAAGSTFDAIWCLNADDEQWMRPPAADPLLPWPFQAEHQMPGTNSESDYNNTDVITARLAASAAITHFSYPASDGNGEKRPSRAVLRCVAEPVLLSNQVALPPVHPYIALEELPDEASVPGLPGHATYGGSSVLKSQAACGFRAFAEHRLFSTEVDERDLGLDALDRGNDVHRVLDIFWKKVKDQDTLKSLTSEIDLTSGRSKRDEFLQEAIETIIQHETSSQWDVAYLQLQKQRLHILLSRWLDFETGRPPFSIAVTEQELRNLQIGPISLNLRIDRIDNVQITTDEGVKQQASMLIDYKTGACNPSSWLSSRPDEPQLPLYATAAGIDNIQAIAFAEINPSESAMRLRGISSQADLVAKNKQTYSIEAFASQINDWRTTLLALATNFAQGDAAVDPKLFPSTCEHCGQRLLCRLDPSNLIDSANEEEDETDL